jgi:hypothetical protein
MGLGASIIIFAIGAILTFGITATANGIDLDAIGVILMVVGIVGGLVSAAFLSSWSPWPYRRTVIRDHDVVDTPPHTHVRQDPYGHAH